MGDSKSLIHELLQGLELARKLRVYLNVSSSSSSVNETRELLIHKIISKFEKALEIINRKGHVNVAEPSQHQQQQQQQHLSASGTQAIRMLDSPPLSSSPRSEDSDRDFKDRDHNTPRKRNTLPIRWTKQIRVTPGVPVEGPLDDGYSWRKYGQKDILGATHPRGYYRCTHRNIQGCLATKQVQRSDEDPTIFEITYRGNHTCTIGSASNAFVPIPTLNPNENQETNVNTNQQLMNLRTGLTVQTENLDFLDQFSPLIQFHPNHVLESSFAENFNSPPTSGVSHISMSPSPSVFPNMATEVIPSSTSVANTPTTDPDFPLQQFQFDGENFTFYGSQFFPSTMWEETDQ